MRRLFYLLTSLLLLSGCSTADINDYHGRRPVLDLFAYFEGESRGWGIVQNRSGKVVREFVVDITGSRHGQDQLHLDERFLFSDGEQSTRLWRLTRQTDGTIIGNAADVVGDANGKIAGNALNLRYVLNLAVEGNTWKINLDDWMFLQPDQVLINRTIMKKFGLRVGEITIVFNKK